MTSREKVSYVPKKDANCLVQIYPHAVVCRQCFRRITTLTQE